MATHFEIRTLQGGYQWKEMFLQQLGLQYAVDILRIPSPCIDIVQCDLERRTLGIWIKENAHLDYGDWFYQLVQTHTHVRTESDLITFY